MRRFALLVLVLLAIPMSGRDLYWDALRVRAHLDAEGQLKVDETQVMVFDGEWNGGERRFDVRSGQGFELTGVDRIDARGRTIVMKEGSLDAVDEYRWFDDHLLRWRSRLPDDPPFRNAKLTYVLHYTIQRLLQRDGELYVLDHDFAFPEREGNIEQLHVQLTLDPVWEPVNEMPGEWSAGPIRPGEHYTLNIPLRYKGTGSPGFAAPAAEGGEQQGLMDETYTISPDDPLPWMVRALFIFPPLMLLWALAREGMAGRLAPLNVSAITPQWLQQNVFTLRPEVVGALWDGDVGEAEVAATIARLVAEGKISSRLEGETLHMTLKVPRSEFKEYEWLLVDAMFVKGEHTSTTKIREHYKESGFNPATTIKENLEEKFVSVVTPKGELQKPWSWPVTALWLASIGVLIHAAMQPEGRMITSLGTAFIGLFACAFALIGPTFWRKRVDFGVPSAILLMLPAFAMMIMAIVIIRNGVYNQGSELAPVWARIGVTLTALWIFASATHALRSRDSREAIAFRKMLAATRAFFRRELQTRNPSLDDAWYPYVIAFGLGGAVQKWFRQFAGTSDTSSFGSGTSSFGSSSTSSSSPTSWSGGGGAFGGAGASGAWVAAAAGVAAGVSAPSSSSGSSGGSSSSSGSSGGGGGGGW